ncbi:8643_t:CDS:2 [Dentiscutata erythropus]|uniref:8643_t:CDS:1 n=1 Tax=Dentiscutata erythropus TaxID=1348616 RepID=A0A9N9EGT7_9GLOM|nr:8643_t:CDS:2 [Dentiscutata erythropus]
MDVNGDQEIQESEPTIPTTKSQEDKQGDKYTIMLLKEKWEEIEILLKRRNNLNLIKFVISLFIILFGIALFYIFWKKNISDTVHIITSSVLDSGGVLSLLNILAQKWQQNKDTVTSLVGAVNKIPLLSDKVFMPALLQISDELINDKLVKKCKDYLRFLDRIKYLINAEKRDWVIIIAILSLYVIITSVISILINSKHIDFILAISIIIIGCLCLYNIILSFFERIVEKMLNYTIEPPTSSDHIKMIIYTMGLIFLKPTIDAVITILSYYYIFSKRLYLIDDNKFTLDDYGRILPNEETNTSMSSCNEPQLEEDTEKIKEKDIDNTKNLAKILKFGNPMNLIEEYVIFTFILVLRMKTEYQFKIESIEITEKQRDELRSILCGLVQYSYIEEKNTIDIVTEELGKENRDK